MHIWIVTLILDIKKNFLVIPYIKPISEKIMSIINKSEITVGFRCLNKLNRFIKIHKDQNQSPMHYITNVIYKICCKDCDAFYVRQIKRLEILELNTRIKKHINKVRLDLSKHSVVSEHIKSLNHSFD